MIRLHVARKSNGQALRLGSSGPTEDGSVALLGEGDAQHTWVEVVQPTPEELERLKRELGLHEVALDEALRSGTPAKLEDYGEHLFLIAHSPQRGEDGHTRKVSVFLSKSWIVTVVRMPLPWLETLRELAVRDPARCLHSPDQFLYQLLDRANEGFERLVDEQIDQIEELEDQATERPNPQVLRQILEQRRNHVELMRVIRGQRDACSALTRSSHPALSKKIAPYLRAVSDHVLRLYELLDGVRDNLSATRDAYLATVNNRLSDVMRILTVIATLMMPLTLVTGIFGMNFDAMPLLHSATGFWLVMTVMLSLALVMLHQFRRRGWL